MKTYKAEFINMIGKKIIIEVNAESDEVAKEKSIEELEERGFVFNGSGVRFNDEYEEYSLKSIKETKGE